MIIHNGVDLVEVRRIADLYARQGERFLARIYTEAERAYCLRKANPGPSLAARFAAKEAVMKCLGTGWSDGVGFAQIEVVRAPSGAPAIRLTGRAAEVAQAIGIERIHLSLTHTDDSALAFAIAEGRSG